MLLCRAQELSPFTISSFPNPNPNPNPKRSSLTILRHHRFLLRTFSLLQPLSLSSSGNTTRNSSHFSTPLASTAPSSSSVEPFADEELDSSNNIKSEFFDFDASFGTTESKHLRSPPPLLEVKELEELPEQWRRSRLAWLCKELPAHKTATLIRVLNAQRKWIKQEDATYVAVHCLRIRENEAGFRVYKWMMQQNWFRFDFALGTKLADYMGKERKFLKCREIFDDIINQGRVPSESTFHILIIAYLSSPSQGCLDEACNIYNQMIQLGNYKPRLSLHNSLFRAVVSRPGGSSKNYLKQAEFIYHNLTTSGLEIHKDMYGGLIWLHSYQDTIDKERIESLRAEMQLMGIQESREVLVSILRACSKEGDVEGAERTWLKLIQFDDSVPSQAYVYRMEVYAKVGEPMKSLQIFRGMQENLGTANVAAYHKIIEVLSKAQEIELAESLMTEFMESGLKPLMPCFIDLMGMYFKLGLHNKLESTFSMCLEKCRPNRTIYNLYLDSLLNIGNLDKAGEIFEEMHNNESIGVNTRSCNGILSGYLSSEEYVKAEKIYDIMCQKKYEIETPLMEKLDYVLSLNKKVVKKPINPKLSKEQREILIGLLLGGLQMDSEEDRMNCVIRFEFNENFVRHSMLKRHIYEQYHEWLASHSKPSDVSDDIPCQFVTISHSYFRLYVDQFWPNGRPAIPKLIHRWLSPRVLAYWYMYGGHRTSSGDIVLKLKGNEEDIQRIVKTLKTKSLNCKVKRKGRVFWIGFLGSNSSSFWKLIEPHILDDLKDDIKAGGQSFDESSETRNISFVSGSDSDENGYKYSAGDNS